MTPNKTPVTRAFFLFFKGRKILALERMVIHVDSCKRMRIVRFNREKVKVLLKCPFMTLKIT